MATNKEPKELLALFSNDCMTCSHLVEGASTAFVKCHYSKGNTQCPASEIYMVVVGEAELYAKRVLAARDKRFPKREAKLLAYVGLQSKAFQSKFYEALEVHARTTS